MSRSKERLAAVPSKLDERLEEYRDVATGKIMITAEQAKDVLLSVLYSNLKNQLKELPRPHNRPSPKIEALAVIIERDATFGGSKTAYNYEDFKTTIERQNEQEERSELERDRRTNIVKGSVPKSEI